MRHISIPAGWLEGLVDLNTEKDSVRERLAAYLTDVLSLGFSGVRIDAAKHIQPDDLVAIFSKLRRNLGGALPEDFVAWLEVLLGGEADLLMCDPDSGYNYGSYLADGLAAAGFDDADIEKIKIWNSGYPKEPANGYCTITPSRNAIQNDDADQQTDGSTSRDMGDQGCVLVEGCEEATHRAFEVQLFENPNGASDNDVDYPIRLVLSRCTPRRNNSNDKQRATKQTHSTDFDSCAHAALASVCLCRDIPLPSYYWQGNSYGLPDGRSDCTRCAGDDCDGCATTVAWGAYDAASCGYDDEYTRPHRDLTVVNAMRGWMGLDATSYAELSLMSCTV